MSDWISVREQLPKDKQNVLAICTNENSFGENVFIARFIGGREFHDFFKNWVPVTHWMPLPDPPEEAK